MPWTDITRLQHNRDRLRYPTDLTDREWAVIAPLIPSAKPGGRPRKTNMREVVNAILYIAGSGSQWRALPKDFPPVSTVRGYFYGWRDIGLWQTINHLLLHQPAYKFVCESRVDNYQRRLCFHKNPGILELPLRIFGIL